MPGIDLLGRRKRRDDSNSYEPAAYGVQRGIVASAQRISMSSDKEVQALRSRATASQWQERAWQHYDAIGEIKYGFNYLAAVASRIRLYPGAVITDQAAPVPLHNASSIERDDVEDPDAEDIQDDAIAARQAFGIDPRIALLARDTFADIFKDTNVSGLIRMFFLNILVPGECYLLLHKGEWSIRSTSELKVSAANRAQLWESTRTGHQPEGLPQDVTVGRVWRQHPRYSSDPDSSLLGVQDSADEVMLYGRMFRSVARSKISAGMLYVPEEITAVNQRPIDPENPEPDEDEDDFEAELLYAMATPITDEMSASSVVPMLLRGPAELGKQITRIDLSRESDEFLVARAERALERVLQGIDLPKDIATGLANVKYSNAVQIDDTLYRAHVEPLALMLVDAITEVCFWPTFRARVENLNLDMDEARKVVVWYDPSELVAPLDRGEEADNGHDRATISDAAWREAHGFSDVDAPDEQEIARRLAMKSPLPPEVLMPLLQALIPGVLDAARKENLKAKVVPARAGIPEDGAETEDGPVAPVSRIPQALREVLPGA